MLRSPIPNHNNNRHLTFDEVENNIGGLPVTDSHIKALFDSLDTEHTGTISVDVLKNFFNGLDHFGVLFSDNEVNAMIRKYTTTYDNSLTYDEFACFVLRIAQW